MKNVTAGTANNLYAAPEFRDLTQAWIAQGPGGSEMDHATDRTARSDRDQHRVWKRALLGATPQHPRSLQAR